MFDAVALPLRRLFDTGNDAVILVVTKVSHERAANELQDGGVDMGRVEIRKAVFDEVNQLVACIDAGIFFIKLAWSKRASCPTRNM